MIKYDEYREAFILTYYMWGRETDVFLYAPSMDEVNKVLSQISDKIDRIKRNREKLVKIMRRDGWYGKGGRKISDRKFAEEFIIQEIHVYIEDIGITIRFLVRHEREQVRERLAIELEPDNSIFIAGWE